ncbi:hypothetical protein M9458_003072, partial [Cirrhinus mrigala]
EDIVRQMTEACLNQSLDALLSRELLMREDYELVVNQPTRTAKRGLLPRGGAKTPGQQTNGLAPLPRPQHHKPPAATLYRPQRPVPLQLLQQHTKLLTFFQLIITALELEL